MSIEEENRLLKKRIAELEALIEQLSAENSSLSGNLGKLKEQVAWLSKQLFGTGKNEASDKNQQWFQWEEEHVSAPEEEPVETTTRRKRGKGIMTKEERYENVPVGETITLLPEEVRQNPDDYEEIGQPERTIEIKLEELKLSKTEILRPKFRKKNNKTLAPIQAKAPARPIQGTASISLIVYILINKYLYHIPLYRLEKMLENKGATIPRKTMGSWVAQVAEWFEVIYELMRLELVSGDYLQVDETVIKVIDPDIKNKGARKAYLWPISRPGGDVIFTWSLTRACSHLEEILKGFEGYLQCDGYSVYDSYAAKRNAETKGSVELAGCMSHARRKFTEAADAGEKKASSIIEAIKGIYAIEKELRESGADVQSVYQRRQEESKPLMDALHTLIKDTQKGCLNCGLLDKACQYALNQWEKICRFLEDGRLQIDNNLMENAIRPTAVGKKNWLFIGHPDAGHRSAVIYSIIVSCQRRGIDPSEYMQDVLSKLPELQGQDCSHLTPANWAAAKAIKEQAQV